MEKIVYVVFAVDTEGPLHESLAATFERLNEIFGYQLEASYATLKKLQNKEINLNGNEELVRDIFSNARINCHSSWEQIDAMLDDITSTPFRYAVKDSFGGGWVYNWFCLDHVGITGLNPRRRDMGYHNIYDHYLDYLSRKEDTHDSLQWHYHALSLTNDAHRAGTTYLNSDHIYNILCRKIIERQVFPSAFRPGHHTERPDSHFFLEQWIPFDYGNDATTGEKMSLEEVSPVRYGSWQRAPRSWIPYHPAHDDYQVPGQCRRLIARCLPVDERMYQTSQADVMQAFEEARQQGASILSFTSHDFRNMKPGVERMRQLISTCAAKFKDVKFKYATATEAMRGALKLDGEAGIGFKVEIKKFKTHARLCVSVQGEVFGPQPFLALKTKANSFHWQNFDFEGPKQWSYSFDTNNILIDQIAHIGIAANTPGGQAEIVTIDVANNQLKTTVRR